MAKRLMWTPSQREVADFIADGYTQDEIVGMGYSEALVVRIRNALKAGKNPTPRKGGDDKAAVKSVPESVMVAPTPVERTGRAQPQPVPEDLVIEPEAVFNETEGAGEGAGESVPKVVPEKAGDGRVLAQQLVPGRGLTFAVTINTKTLAFYQVFQSRQKEPVTLGDFFDVTAEDFFRGRGYDLGLVKIGGGDGK